MRRREFINELKKALENELTNEQIQVQVNYYTDYIEKEVQSGRLEEDVINDLGDPFAIAQTIITMEPQVEQMRQEESSAGSGQSTSDVGRQGTGFDGKTVQWSSNSQWGCWIALILGVLIVAGIIALIFNVIQFFLPILIPVVLIFVVINFFNKKS